MAVVTHLTVEAADPGGADRFYAAVLGAEEQRIRVRGGEPPAGFGGFALSPVVPGPQDVDHLISAALEAGATSLRPAKKSLWGYGGVFQAPDGTIWTVASSSKKNTGPATGRIEDLVLQLGVADVAASKRFYSDKGFTVAKSYGRRYVELDTGPVALTLNQRDALAKAAGVRADDRGARRLTIGTDVGPFTDPDGFGWETAVG